MSHHTVAKEHLDLAGRLGRQVGMGSQVHHRCMAEEWAHRMVSSSLGLGRQRSHFEVGRGSQHHHKHMDPVLFLRMACVERLDQRDILSRQVDRRIRIRRKCMVEE